MLFLCRICRYLNILLSGSRICFYDFDDFIKYLANDEQYQRFTACMEKAVISKYATPYSYYAALYGARKIKRFSGLSVLRAPILSDEVVRLVQAALPGIRRIIN